MEEFIKVCLFLDDSSFSMDMLGDASPEDIFGDSQESDSPFGESDQNNEENNNKADEDVDPDKIFDESNPQGNVGDEVDSEEQVETPESDKKDEGSSPKTTFYSSALKALKDDGVLPDLEDDFINGVDGADKFAEAIDKQVEARLDAQSKRIKEALDNKVQEDDISYYEGIIGKLNNISEEVLSKEDDAGENLRRQIIYQDYINKGFDEAKAKKMVERSFNSGSDIDDAKEALEGNKQFFQDEYNSIIENNKQLVKREKEERDKQINEFKKKVLETDSPFGITVDKSTRQKVFDNIAKPTYKDKDGNILTNLQKYQTENPMDAEYYFGLFYTMTDGFKNLDKFVGQKTKQQVKSSLKELEHKLRNTPLNGDGSVDFGFGSDDKESFFSKKYKLDT